MSDHFSSSLQFLFIIPHLIWSIQQLQYPECKCSPKTWQSTCCTQYWGPLWSGSSSPQQYLSSCHLSHSIFGSSQISWIYPIWKIKIQVGMIEREKDMSKKVFYISNWTKGFVQLSVQSIKIYGGWIWPVAQIELIWRY